MNWTDERIEKLKKLWSKGLSASQIATQLGGGVSRNAVIGKVHRLNLPGRAKAGGNVATVRPSPTRLAAHSASLKDEDEVEIDTAEVLDYVPASNLILPVSRRLTLTELTECTCKWPVGDPLKDDFHFCGCESSDASPYCGFHAKLAYQPVNERRKA